MFRFSTSLEKIVSRKHIKLDEVQDGYSQGVKYIDELAEKYMPNLYIANVPSNMLGVLNEGLAGKMLQGNMILEIPEQSTQNAKDIFLKLEEYGKTKKPKILIQMVSTNVK